MRRWSCAVGEQTSSGKSPAQIEFLPMLHPQQMHQHIVRNHVNVVIEAAETERRQRWQVLQDGEERLSTVQLGVVCRRASGELAAAQKERAPAQRGIWGQRRARRRRCGAAASAAGMRREYPRLPPATTVKSGAPRPYRAPRTQAGRRRCCCSSRPESAGRRRGAHAGC